MLSLNMYCLDLDYHFQYNGSAIDQSTVCLAICRILPESQLEIEVHRAIHLFVPNMPNA